MNTAFGSTLNAHNLEVPGKREHSDVGAMLKRLG
jgi:hypothetical protein